MCFIGDLLDKGWLLRTDRDLSKQITMVKRLELLVIGFAEKETMCKKQQGVITDRMFSLIL